MKQDVMINNSWSQAMHVVFYLFTKPFLWYVCTFKKPILDIRLFSFQFEKVLNNKSYYILQMADFTTMKVSKSQEAVASQDCS